MKLSLVVPLLCVSLVACAARTGDKAGEGESAETSPGYAIPADWNVHTVASSPSQGVEPLNVILTAKTDVPLESILAALDAAARWKSVEIGTSLLGPLEGACISEEDAAVDPGAEAAAQALSLRVDGCGGIVEHGEVHARGWRQDTGAWFFALSHEHVCLHGFRPWHCIDADGYDVARDDFVRELEQAAATHGWVISCEAVARPAGSGLDAVAFDDVATACTIVSR